MPEVIFGLVAVISVALYIREYTLRKRMQDEDAHVMSQTAEASYEALKTALGKSEELITKAEADSEKLVSDSRISHDKEEKLVDQAVQTAVSHSEADLKAAEEKYAAFLAQLSSLSDNHSAQALQSFNNYLEHLKIETQKAQALNWEGATQRVNALFENFESKLADFLLQSEQKMMLSVDLELKSARQLIDTYKVQQMNIVDENIISMLESTLASVLGKNLNLKDQMDLVYESLEKAKADSFLS